MGNKIGNYSIPTEEIVSKEGGTCSFRSRFHEDINGPFNISLGFPDIKTALKKSFLKNKSKKSLGTMITKVSSLDAGTSNPSEPEITYEFITYEELHQKVVQLAQSMQSMDL